jgi:putative ABC transport system permease protein
MVKVQPGVDPHTVALQIVRNTTGMYPIESPNLFGTFRGQMDGLLWGFFILTIIIWILAALMIGVNLSMAANERKREMAVLRAVGATPGFVFRLILLEAGILAAAGTVVGITGAAFLMYMFKNAIEASLKMPFLFPSMLSLLGLFGIGLAVAIFTVTLAALWPAIRVSRQELAISMRE